MTSAQRVGVRQIRYYLEYNRAVLLRYHIRTGL